MIGMWVHDLYTRNSLLLFMLLNIYKTEDLNTRNEPW